MSILSVGARRLATINYGVLDIPYMEISETFAEVSASPPYAVSIAGKSFYGSVPGMYYLADSGTYVGPVTNNTQAFEQYPDVKFYTGEHQNNVRLQKSSMYLWTVFGEYGSADNPKLAVTMPAIVKTSDDHYVYGYVNLLNRSTDDTIVIEPDSLTFGYFNLTGLTGESFEILADSLTDAGQAYMEQLMEISVESDGDPYGLGGFSGAGGGTGTFSGTGDNIGIPALPTLSAVSAGFITLFNPSAAQMAALAGYMWTGAFDLENFRKIFADPMDCILGLSIVPVNVPAGSMATVKVGNISTGVSMTTAASQYVEVDCGTLNVEEFWGAYLDYDPYTKAEIYLPYIGTHAIAVDDIMGKAVHVVYHVDILSGACVAYVQCGGTVLYSFIGQCSSSIPISDNDWTNVVNGVLSIAGNIGSMVATGGASAPTAVSSMASTVVNHMKPSIEKSGAMSGTGGMMGVQTPYLILTRPRQALPTSQNKYLGYPSFITENLVDLSGYTEIEQIHLENVPATSGEIAELESLLKGGVIF